MSNADTTSLPKNKTGKFFNKQFDLWVYFNLIKHIQVKILLNKFQESSLRKH
jgi:hypothetical protein